MSHYLDPNETPPPRRIESQSTDSITIHPECLHPELIDDVRQTRKRRWVIIPIVITVLCGALGTLATCVYTQGQAAGATEVRVHALEIRTSEDRGTTDRLAERQRQDAAEAAQRHEELLQEFRRMDNRLSRIEERLPARTGSRE